MAKTWDPNSYTLQQQLLDIIRGKDVVVGDDGVVMKGDQNHVDIYWKSNSSKGHGHAGFDFDDNGKLIHWEIYHE